MKSAITVSIEPDGRCRVTVGQCYTIISREDAVALGSAVHQIFTLPWTPKGEKDEVAKENQPVLEQRGSCEA